MVYHVAGYHNVNPAIFLDMTIVEMHTYIDGITDMKRQKAEYDFKSTDTLNHMLGQYIAIATHDPKKYPRDAYSKAILLEEKKEQTTEEMVLALKAWMGVLGGKEVVYE